MTRKHFIEVAATIAAANITDTARRHIAGDLADTFAGINSNFKRQTFLDACGV